jgi:hypothetical protein
MKHLKAIVFCMILLLAAAVAVPAFAEGVSDFDPEKPCSLSVTLTTEDGQKAAGAEVMIYQVANATVAEEGFRYVYTEAFQGCGLVLRDLNSAKLAADLYAYAQQKTIQGTALFTNANGVAHFENLHAGLYLATEVGDTGEFAAIKPFLVTLPRVSEDNEIIYHTNAMPKVTSDRSTALKVRKVWNDDGKKRPANVQVQILRGSKVYDTVTLSEQNNWSARWDCVVYADDWSVKEVSVPQGYTVTYQKDGMVFTVTNTETLIQTGQTNRPVPFLAGGGLVLMLLGAFLISSGRKQSDEKG